MSASEPNNLTPVGGVVDLAPLVAAGALDISAETKEDPADRDHRHAQEAADGRLRRIKDGIRFALVALGVTAIGGLAAFFALMGANPDAQGWGRTVLASILSASMGYFVGAGKKD